MPSGWEKAPEYGGRKFGRIEHVLFVLMAVGLLLLIGWVIAGRPAPAAEANPPTVNVWDGDDVILRGVDYRLEGVDAFESPQTCSDASGGDYDCGAKASAALGEILAWGEVTCAKVKPNDERWIGNCTAGGKDVAAEMVRVGWAVVRPDFISQDRASALCAIEAEARHAKRGAWAGSFEHPYFAKGGKKKSREEVSCQP